MFAISWKIRWKIVPVARSIVVSASALLRFFFDFSTWKIMNFRGIHDMCSGSGTAGEAMKCPPVLQSSFLFLPVFGNFTHSFILTDFGALIWNMCSVKWRSEGGRRHLAQMKRKHRRPKYFERYQISLWSAVIPAFYGGPSELSHLEVDGELVVGGASPSGWNELLPAIVTLFCFLSARPLYLLATWGKRQKIKTKKARFEERNDNENDQKQIKEGETLKRQQTCI